MGITIPDTTPPSLFTRWLDFTHYDLPAFVQDYAAFRADENQTGMNNLYNAVVVGLNEAGLKDRVNLVWQTIVDLGERVFADNYRAGIKPIAVSYPTAFGSAMPSGVVPLNWFNFVNGPGVPNIWQPGYEGLILKSEWDAAQGNQALADLLATRVKGATKQNTAQGVAENLTNATASSNASAAGVTSTSSGAVLGLALAGIAFFLLMK